jgi:glucose/arabinose dehydrogenase
MNVRRILAIWPLALGLSPLAAQDYKPTPVDLPESTYDGKLKAPRGVVITEFARVAAARAMAVGPDGAVYVSLPRRNEVVRLVDANNDGVAETQEIAVSGLNRPHGMAFRDGWMYIANTDGVVRLRLGADGKASGTLEKINEYSAMGGHWTRSIVFGADGAMYVSIGSTCNVCEERSPDRAAVMRYDADGKNGRLFSSGLRNAVGMALHPTTRQVWVTQHERDNLAPDHQDLPPEEINILRDGAHFGWPYCHSSKVPNPEFNDAARCATTEPPALGMQAHSAPLGITFLDQATRLPAEFRGDAIVAFHGSWNRTEPTGAKLVRVRVRDGRPVGYEDFVTGWQGPDGRRWGRPVDVVVHRDGSLLVSDDQAGIVYRIAMKP